MNLEWLKSYMVIVEEKSITKAAERLNISQPALSKQLKGLEGEYNTRLLNRTTKGIEVTEAGCYLYNQAKSLIQQSNLIKREIQEISGSNKMIIGSLPSVATSYLPRFQLENHCVFIQNYSQALIHALENNQVNISLIDNFFYNGPLVKKDLFSEGYVALVPKNYNLGQVDELSWKLIEQYPLILHSSPCDTSIKIKSYADDHNIQLNITKYVPYGEFLYGYVLSGEGMTVVPQLISQNLRHLDIDFIPVEDLSLTISAVARTNRILNAFLSLIEDKVIK
ncbi:LysR family transcriptional regulator [Amphibacillus cookii]|uniref:LysR family transcriptional regulator n=1 Tax=Amphibacillus cookii TaxID=767787 RepID=UPI0019584FF7|nr:LysR family transcriptional regulator [Amphibacillus cookii]MBM7542264.1 DNA-binding transcriptional LysR family regulator [Amphibacillus cookii]